MVSENPYFFYSFYGGVGSTRRSDPDQTNQVDVGGDQTTQVSSNKEGRILVEDSSAEPVITQATPEV